jgi:hypothetical protein
VITSLVDGPYLDMWQASFTIQSKTQTQERQMHLYSLNWFCETVHGSKVNPLLTFFNSNDYFNLAVNTQNNSLLHSR